LSGIDSISDESNREPEFGSCTAWCDWVNSPTV
jgi:hypothetical protein